MNIGSQIYHIGFSPSRTYTHGLDNNETLQYNKRKELRNNV